MKNLVEFIRYIVDARKVKTLVLTVQLFTLSMLVGCRSQLAKDSDRFEARLAEVQAAHEVEIQQLTARAESGIYATQYLSSQYESDAWMVAQWLDCLDARYTLTDEAKKLACWVIFNRVDSEQYPDDIEGVLTQPRQFDEFSDECPPTENNMVIATNQVARWKSEDIRPVPVRAVFITVSSNGVEIRDSFEETRSTGYWRA